MVIFFKLIRLVLSTDYMTKKRYHVAILRNSFFRRMTPKIARRNLDNFFSLISYIIGKYINESRFPQQHVYFLTMISIVMSFTWDGKKNSTVETFISNRNRIGRNKRRKSKFLIEPYPNKSDSFPYFHLRRIIQRIFFS